MNIQVVELWMWIFIIIQFFRLIYRVLNIRFREISRSIDWYCGPEFARKMDNWLIVNPGVSIFHTKEVRDMIIDHMFAYLYFLEKHSFLKFDQEYFNHLAYLLTYTGEDPPPKIKTPPKERRFFVQIKARQYKLANTEC